MSTDKIAVIPIARSMVPPDTVALARFLLGKIVVRQMGAGTALGRIVETEAYLETDPACHAFRGMTPRNRSLFLEVGHAYVYVCYGTSLMLNVSSEAAGTGAGVLLRALQPISGIEHMQRARNGGRGMRVRDLARGPGRLTAALKVDLRHDGIDLFRRGALWIGNDDAAVGSIGQSVRIGLTKGADARLRYFIAGNDYLSGTRRLNV
jgi:DNA-3-methyladenine glycosylase